MAKKKVRLLVIHGPNLNLIGTWGQNIYGGKTLAEIDRSLIDHAKSLDIHAETFQSNSEGEIIDCIQGNSGSFDGIIVNPAGLMHTSYSLRTTISSLAIPTIEVHLSNIHARNDIPLKSVIADVCVGQISGLGHMSYLLAITGLADIIRRNIAPNST